MSRSCKHSFTYINHHKRPFKIACCWSHWCECCITAFAMLIVLRSLVCIIDGVYCYSLECRAQCAGIVARRWPTEWSQQRFRQFVFVLFLSNIFHPNPILFRHLCHHSFQRNIRAKLKKTLNRYRRRYIHGIVTLAPNPLICRYSQSVNHVPALFLREDETLLCWQEKLEALPLFFLPTFSGHISTKKYILKKKSWITYAAP